jgi:hypothetical protein
MTNDSCRLEDYLLRECDHTERSFSICFRIPPELWREVARLIKGGEFPFESPQDLYRWAFNRGFRSLTSMEPTPPIQMRELPFLALEKTLPQNNRTFFGTLEQTVFKLRALGYGPRRLRRLANAIEELVQCMPATNHRGTYLTQVKMI